MTRLTSVGKPGSRLGNRRKEWKEEAKNDIHKLKYEQPKNGNLRKAVWVLKRASGFHDARKTEDCER